MHWDRVEPFACGQVRCAAVIRMLWQEPAFSIAAIGRIAGSSFTQVTRIADRMGLGLRPNARRKVSLSAATVRKNYHRRDMTVHQIADMLGCNVRTLQRRAKKLGLPARKDGRLKTMVDWPEDFDDLWREGITIAEILRACTRPPKSASQATLFAKRRGLPRRGAGPNANHMTLEEARDAIAARRKRESDAQAESVLAAMMRKAAARERAAWNAQYGRGSHAAA